MDGKTSMMTARWHRAAWWDFGIYPKLIILRYAPRVKVTKWR